MNKTALSHTPVMSAEVMEALGVHEKGKYLDGTEGLGGHSEAILNVCSSSRLCGLDRDREALEIAEKRLSRFGERARLFQMSYADFEKALASVGWHELDGALLDLGVSSMQLDDAKRGFSFRSDGPLDMRMDQASGSCGAWQMVNSASMGELEECIATLGEDPLAGRIARHIVESRASGPIGSTARLAEIVRQAYPAKWRDKSRRHPATRTFQALRMAVNDELGQLGMFLEKIMPRLAIGGRLVIISFHSLEDRLVKQAIRGWAKGCVCPPRTRVCVCGHKPEVRILYKRPLTPGDAELAANPRAGSAKLRAVEKIADIQA